MRLQTQLTLSHLLVTLISILILVIGLLVGYWFYLQSDLPAAWAADWADIYAAEVDVYVSDDCRTCVTRFIENEILPVTDFPTEDEWLIVIAADGTIFDSNYPLVYPAGANIYEQLPFGIQPDDFIADTTTYRNLDDRHFALSAMANGGWVYFHGGTIDNAFQLQQTAQTAFSASLALGVIGLIVSGLMGWLLSRLFSRRLTRLGQISASLAAGDLRERVPAGGGDEISQLGAQFNTMADTIGQQIDDLRQLADKNAQLAEEAEGLARLEERNRLARDLHDAVKQQLFGLNLTLGSIPALLEKQPDVAETRLQQVINQTGDIQVELDQIIRQMRPASLQDQGLAEALQALADQWTAQTTIPVQLTIQEQRSLPLAHEQALYRIVQECLQNIGKHAGASAVAVALHYEPGQVRLQVTDNGQGFDIQAVDKRGSFGLENIRQRAEALGGELAIQSKAGGTRITVWVPT